MTMFEQKSQLDEAISAIELGGAGVPSAPGWCGGQTLPPFTLSTARLEQQPGPGGGTRQRLFPPAAAEVGGMGKEFTPGLISRALALVSPPPGTATGVLPPGAAPILQRCRNRPGHRRLDHRCCRG